MAEPSVTPLGNGVYRVEHAERSRLAYAASSADGSWIFLDGHVYVVEKEDGAKGTPRKRRGDDHGALTAPMPATVIKIIATPGQRVSKGDVLIMLEAMKMELPIKSPRDATVAAIKCRPGELVQPGVPLLELE